MSDNGIDRPGSVVPVVTVQHYSVTVHRSSGTRSMPAHWPVATTGAGASVTVTEDDGEVGIDCLVVVCTV